MVFVVVDIKFVIILTELTCQAFNAFTHQWRSIQYNSFVNGVVHLLLDDEKSSATEY